MSKNLVIVESPAKAKTIQKYLGKDFEVKSSFGHIRDLPKKGMGIDLQTFTPDYQVSSDKKKLVSELKEAVKKADTVWLASDEDREGEAIAWHLAQELNLKDENTKRIVFHEITKNAILKAVENPRKIDKNLVNAQQARRVLDRIVGFEMSPILWKKVKTGLSAGRVQSVAVRLIVEREQEIRDFKPTSSYKVEGIFQNSAQQEIPTKLKRDFTEEAEAEKFLEQAKNTDFSVLNVEVKPGTRSASAPFTTSTLQQEASNKLGYGVTTTMRVAQRLYEEGFITYMRTDSVNLSQEAINSAKSHIIHEFGEEYSKPRNYTTKSSSAQEAHEAIRPTNLANTPEKLKAHLTSEQYKLYALIYARALSSLMSAAKYDSLTLTLSQNGYDFTASGSTMKFDGYLKVYGEYESGKDVVLPSFEEQEQIAAKELKANQHFTEPPARYTEAKLIKALEEDGIGRPSTYAMIIDTIQARGYVTLEKTSESSRTKVFKPTEQGILTTEKLDEFFQDIINVRYTAKMESTLDEIADGTAEEVATLKEFYNRFQPLLEHAYENMEKKELEKVGEVCPDCGGELVYRTGRFGKFISCSNFPKCRYTRQIDKPEKEKPEPTGKICPDCGSELLKRKSRYGTYFLGCSNFPKCHYMENLEGERIVSKKDKVKAEKETKTTKKTSAKKTTKKAATKKTTAKKTTKKSTTKKTTTKRTKKNEE